MKRTILIGASMFALTFGVSAQTDLSAFQTDWMITNNVTQMTPALYEQMKSEWTAANESLTARPSAESILLQENAAKKAAKLQEQGLPSTFPLKVNTGNPAADEAAYQLAKANWIQNNPTLYNQLITTPTMTAAEREQIRTQELNNQ